MNSYTNFASVYDRLMSADFDYEKWADYIENLFLEYHKDVTLAADLACGTGNITLPLSRRGYDMIGLDSSSDMLDLARKKAQKENLDILFLNQNMTRMDLYGTVDAFLCMIDGMDGMFIFDISTEYKLKEVIGDKTFIYSDNSLFYSWENRYLEKMRISDMELTFFEKQKSGSYRRFSERHLQRAHRPEELCRMLKKAGFSRVDCFAELSFHAPGKNEHRIVFAAR